ncbi:Uncharacterized protein K02A2.6 [Eumeta japonica]|uniref:RNA-directed DNA polymerase n=1 Tax=Eumeta variegata TaxID=151549 RepID=A0A4C1T699_EUMVA|nr:Uncharacterized protein K02A2.6 [Eumeta japonica]
MAEWAARVRTLARYCNFQSELDIMLRDRFILGLQDVRERERLFTEDTGKITFVAAMELVQSVQGICDACREKGDARASHYLAAELAGDVEAYSDYATPITPVLKSDGTVRVCGDYSVTLNKVLHIDRYPLPRIEELFARLHEGKEFSKLDLSMAYMQLELTEDSQPLTCINTHRGLSNLHDWLRDRQRWTSPGKVKAIKEAEPPKNVSQLKSFLGLVNYYRSFVPRVYNIRPLHDLLKMGAKWMWSEAHQSAFETVKRALESELALAHYDPRLSTVLTVDASPTGLPRLRSSRRTAPRE